MSRPGPADTGREPVPRSARPLTLLGLAALPPAALLAAAGGVPVAFGPHAHFWAVGVTSAVTALAAAVLLGAALRARDARVLVVAGAFLVMTALLALHGLATPGILVDGAAGILMAAGGLTLPAGAALLAASAEPALRGARMLRPAGAVVAAAVGAVAVAGLAGLLQPALIPMIPGRRSPEALALLVAGLACLAVVGLRTAGTWLLTRRPRDAAATGAIAMLGAALVAGYVWSWAELGFWLGHGLELTGLLVLGAAAALDLRDGAPSRALHGDLRAAELVLREEAYLGVQVRALMRRLAEKDAYTEGHTRRVAILAARVGEELRLPPARLRHLALAGLLHDVGKLRVPDAVLTKPGPLTDEEFAVIRRHPLDGDALLGSLGGFPAGVRAVVRGHHERLDGSGYPDGLRGDALALETRIMAVCDVYDALVTRRVYRDAWSHGDAMALLERESGTGFDPRCVEALRRVLDVPAPAGAERYADVVALAETAAAREDAPQG